MRFILRKYVDAETAKEAMEKDAATPVHDIYLKDGEEPKRDNVANRVFGFIHPSKPSFGFKGEPFSKKQ